MTATEAPALAPASAPVKTRSGGPKTQAGKDSARRNALKHGMRAKVIFPDDLAGLITERTSQYHDQHQPTDPYESWLLAQVAVNTTLLDRCVELTVADIGRRVDRAELCWDDDRRLAAEDLGAKLSKNPGRTVAALRQTTQGADWLIERWHALGEILRTAGEWDDDQRTLALNLLGTPPELRQGNRLLPPDADPETLSHLVADQIATLRAHQRESLDILDAEDRELTQLGAPAEDDRPTRLLRRYEAGCRRALYWAIDEFDRVRSGKAPAASIPDPVAAPPPVPPCPKPSSNPDDDPSFVLTSMLARLAASLAEADGPELDQPEAVEPETPANDAASPTLGRRARRAKEKQARINAKRAAKAAA